MGQEHNLSEQLQLFDFVSSKKPETDQYDPANWAQSDATVWHSTTKKSSPHETATIGRSGDYSGFHVGTRPAADEATRYSRRRRDRSYPYRMTGSSALSPSFNDDTETVWEDIDANSSWANEEYGGEQSPPYAANARGEHVPYHNDEEDAGSTSFRAAPENLMTWSEHVLSDPNAPEHWREKAKTHELVAHVGKPQYNRSDAFTPTIVQSPLPGMDHLSPTKMTVERPSLPPDMEIAHVFDDIYTNYTKTNPRTETYREPQHKYLVFEPKKGRRKGK